MVSMVTTAVVETRRSQRKQVKRINVNKKKNVLGRGGTSVESLEKGAASFLNVNFGG